MFGWPEFSFRAVVKFPGGRASIPGKSRLQASRAANFALATTSLWAMDGDSRPGNRSLFQHPMPIIGVRRALRQGGAHDDAPPYDPSRTGRPLPARGRARTANRVFFRGPGG